MSYRRRRYSKRELLGSLHVDCILSVSDLGLSPGANRWEVLRAFLDRGEARAERLVEDKDGFLILQSIPGRRNTGAIYVYRESLGAFFWLSFGKRQDDLSGEDFQNALRIYKLVRFIADTQKHGYSRRCGRRAARRAFTGRMRIIPIFTATPPPAIAEAEGHATCPFEDRPSIQAPRNHAEVKFEYEYAPSD